MNLVIQDGCEVNRCRVVQCVGASGSDKSLIATLRSDTNFRAQERGFIVQFRSRCYSDKLPLAEKIPDGIGPSAIDRRIEAKGRIFVHEPAESLQARLEAGKVLVEACAQMSGCGVKSAVTAQIGG